MMTPKEIGQQDYAEAKSRKDNPYRNSGPSRSAWFVGWDSAEAADLVRATGSVFGRAVVWS